MVRVADGASFIWLLIWGISYLLKPPLHLVHPCSAYTALYSSGPISPAGAFPNFYTLPQKSSGHNHCHFNWALLNSNVICPPIKHHKSLLSQNAPHLVPHCWSCHVRPDWWDSRWIFLGAIHQSRIHRRLSDCRPAGFRWKSPLSNNLLKYTGGGHQLALCCVVLCCVVAPFGDLLDT